jgi:hypothetical protein
MENRMPVSLKNFQVTIIGFHDGSVARLEMYAVRTDGFEKPHPEKAASLA